MIKNDLDNIEVPENIDDTIDLAIDKIRQEDTEMIMMQRKTLRKVAMVASVAILIGISSIVVTKPVWATDLPIIGYLININSRYNDYMQVVGTTKSDSGIDITFESAVADSNVLNLTFVVKNNNNSIDDNFNELTNILEIPRVLKVNGKAVNASSGGRHEFIDKNTVRVLTSINWNYKELPDKLNIDIEIGKMFGKSGDWNVGFSLDTSEIMKDTYVEQLDKVIKVDGKEFNLKDITMTPLTTNIKSFFDYTSGEANLINFIVFDENGKQVMPDSSGGSADSQLSGFNQNNNYINNFNTNSLNIIPYYMKYERSDIEYHEEKLPATKIDVDNFSKLNLKISEDMSVDINNCIIDGEYLIVKYKYRYLDKEILDVGGSSRVYLSINGRDNEKENISEEDRDEIIKMYEKYGGDNRESCIIIEKIGNLKNIEIGCYDGNSIELLKDQAFTVTKK